MKQQGTTRLALAVFAFGLSLSLSAFAAPDPCVACETAYQKCVDANILTDQQCATNYLGCMRRGNGHAPCPL